MLEQRRGRASEAGLLLGKLQTDLGSVLGRGEWRTFQEESQVWIKGLSAMLGEMRIEKVLEARWGFDNSGMYHCMPFGDETEVYYRPRKNRLTLITSYETTGRGNAGVVEVEIGVGLNALELSENIMEEVNISRGNLLTFENDDGSTRVTRHVWRERDNLDYERCDVLLQEFVGGRGLIWKTGRRIVGPKVPRRSSNTWNTKMMLISGEVAATWPSERVLKEAGEMIGVVHRYNEFVREPDGSSRRVNPKDWEENGFEAIAWPEIGVELVDDQVRVLAGWEAYGNLATWVISCGKLVVFDPNVYWSEVGVNPQSYSHEGVSKLVLLERGRRIGIELELNLATGLLDNYQLINFKNDREAQAYLELTKKNSRVSRIYILEPKKQRLDC